MDDAPLATDSTPTRRWLWPVLKWGLFAVVMAFVARQGWTLWQTSPRGGLHIDWMWLVPAAAAYLVAWLPSVWFWRTMLKGFGPNPSWSAVIRAYFIGHLGKYVPGKAMVLVIRAALLRDSGCAPGVSVVTAMYETLATMGAGAGIAVALAPFATSPTVWGALPAALQPLRQQTLLLPLLVVGITLLSLPAIAKLFTMIALKMAAKSELSKGPASPHSRLRIKGRTLLHGLFIVSLGWCLLAVSLGCVLRSLGVTTEFLVGFPAWLAATTLSSVGGFVILIAPGGLGVRELLLTEVLQTQPGITEAQAFLAAWLMRAVGLLGELVAAGMLWSLTPARLQMSRHDKALPVGSRLNGTNA